MRSSILELHGKFVLYHGTDLPSAKDINENQILISKSKDYTDFGKGFYLTDDETRAKQWAEHKASRMMLKGHGAYAPEIIAFEVDFDQLKSCFVPLVFKDRNLDWAQFVMNNRIGKAYASKQRYAINNCSGQYDVVIGYIADGNIQRLKTELEKDQKPVGMN